MVSAMSTSLPSNGLDPISLFSSYRESVTRETGFVVLNEAVTDAAYRAEAFGRVAALLASSLEELKVAEQELIERNDELLAQYEESRQAAARERRLFEHAPCALIATNLAGTITEANYAASSLLGYSVSALDRKPVASLIPLEDRTAFRAEFNRVLDAQGTADWQLRLSRPRDVPVRVSAAIQVLERPDQVAGAELLWSLRTVEARTADK
jgi:PAS domain S-box-containing protein